MTPALDARMSEFYRRVDADIAAHRPVCVTRGACCKFAEYGHKLYVSAVELQYFISRQSSLRPRPVPSEAQCPCQVGGLCTARHRRPRGCRVFFCDPAAQKWQPEEYERGLAELKQIEADFHIDYQYMEWLTA